jgi:hypothetical protein
MQIRFKGHRVLFSLFNQYALSGVNTVAGLNFYRHGIFPRDHDVHLGPDLDHPENLTSFHTVTGFNPGLDAPDASPCNLHDVTGEGMSFE